MDRDLVETYILENRDALLPRDYGDRVADGPRNLFAHAARRAKVQVASAGSRHSVFIFNGKTIGGADGFSTSLTSWEGHRAALDRQLSRTYLSLAQLPVPNGSLFAAHDYAGARDYFRQLDVPATVKPRFGESGLGVSLKVLHDSDFKRAWSIALEHDYAPKVGHSGVIVETFHEGLDLRAYVVGEEVVAAVLRLPLFGIGDGRSTIQEMADKAEAARLRNPLLAKFPLDISAVLGMKELAPQAISEDGRVYRLSPGVNMRQGGVTVDVTHRISRELKELAIDARWAVPGTPCAGVDLVVPALDTTSGAKIVDVDAEASFSIHHYPWSGNGHRVADKVFAHMRAR